MIGKLGSPAVWGIAVACIVLLAACSNGPSLQFVTVTPVNGTVFFSAGPASGVKGTRAGANSARKSAAAVSPQDLSSASCSSLQFKANALFSNHSSVDETNSAQWSSSNTSVASVSQTGNATGFNIGTTTIGAVFNGVTASPANLEVDGLNSITMNPSSASIPVTGSQSFQALGNFTLASGSPSQQDISSGFGTTWDSSNKTVATVDNSGKITVKGSGTTNITATSCDFGTVGTAMLTVGPAPVTLLITPTTPTIATGTTVQLTAAHSDGSPLTGAITWSSGTTGVATIDVNLGLALGVASGSSTITAIESSSTPTASLTGTTTLTVQAAAARFAYIGNLDRPDPNSPPSISSYVVSGGTLVPYNSQNFPSGPNQNPYPFGTTTPGPQQVLLHPSGHLLYYIDGSCTVVTVFIDPSTGVLTLSNPEQAAITASGTCVGAIDPLGRYLYVLNETTNAIYGFTIEQSTAQSQADKTQGTLTCFGGVSTCSPPLSDASFNVPNWIMIDRTGSFLYVVNNANDGTTSVGGLAGSITQFNIGAGGVLTAFTPTAAVPAGNGTTNGPFFGTIDRHNNLFVANEGSSSTDETVSAFGIGTNGQLTSLGPDTVITGATDTFNVITSPVADNLYVLDAGSGTGGQVSAYSYTISGSPAAITLTQIGTTTPPTGSSPDGMAIDPTGNLLLVDDFGLNTSPPVNGAVFSYTIAQSGSVTPPPGGFTPTNPASVAAGVGAEFITIYSALATQ